MIWKMFKVVGSAAVVLVVLYLIAVTFLFIEAAEFL